MFHRPSVIDADEHQIKGTWLRGDVFVPDPVFGPCDVDIMVRLRETRWHDQNRHCQRLCDASRWRAETHSVEVTRRQVSQGNGALDRASTDDDHPVHSGRAGSDRQRCARSVDQ